MEKLFKEYENLYSEYRKLFKSQKDFPRNLRTFDIRFRLALDLEVNYKGKYAFVKTKDVKETYISIIKLMDLWNSYEALIRYAPKDKYKLVKLAPSVKKIGWRGEIEKFYKKTGAVDDLKKITVIFKQRMNIKGGFKKDFEGYISRLQKSEKVDPEPKKQALAILEHINCGAEISGIESLALIYSERNMYYHDGEAGKMGMSYSNRKFILNAYKECTVNVILKSICHVLKQEIIRKKEK